jgi:Tfp pilus assembly protein PilX
MFTTLLTTRLTLRHRHRRRGAALMMALFVMTVTTVLVISMIDTETLQYSSIRNTMDWDRARYLAECGVQHAMAELENNIDWRDGVASVEFPAGSGNTYGASVTDGANGTVIINAWGTARSFTRRMQTTLKQGG